MSSLKDQEECLRILYPRLFYNKYRYLQNPQHYLLVDDISMEEMALSEDINGIEVLDMPELISEMLPTLTTVLSTYDPEQVLLIFPGGGGRRVHSYLPPDILASYSGINLQVQRVKDPTRGVRNPSMSEEEREKLYYSLVDKAVVVILDDAINEGATLQYIRYACDINGLSWISASPIIFSPLPQQTKRRTTSSIDGYDAVIGAQVLEGPTNPVRLNFISSLIKRNLYDKHVQDIIANNMKPDDGRRLINWLLRLQQPIEKQV
jgi:hypothetical protein